MKKQACKGMRTAALYLAITLAASVGADGHSSFKRTAVGVIPLGLADPFVYENGARCGMDTGCLSRTSDEEILGEDVLGPFYGLLNRMTTQAGTPIIFTSRIYGDNMQVFRQEFPEGLNGTSTGDKDLVSTAYPRLELISPDMAPDLQYITPGGYMTGWTLMAQGSIWSERSRFRDGEDGGIVILFQPTTSNRTESVLVSPLTQFMAASVSLDPTTSTLDWGVQGLARDIPQGFSLEVIFLPHPDSIVRNIKWWGETVRKYHGTVKIPDPSADYLSYYTDNGAYHYYNPLPFTNFRDAILDIYNHSLVNNIPIRSLQLDSWWYHKGVGQGVKNWTEVSYIIPDGIANLNDVTGWPIVAHNRYFSSDNDYAQQNGGDYSFTIDEATGKALPLEKVFWDDLLDDALGWGLMTYEQDWLDRQYMYTSALHTDVTLGGRWLDQMGEAALERNINIQYCMSLTRHFLHSVTLPAVTQIRVSDDYVLSPDQWRIGVTNLLAHALGLRPYKDVFWSSSENSDNVFKDCDLALPESIWHPWALTHRYGGRRNFTASGKACIPWTDFGWDDKYYGSGMALNLCRNPEDLRDGPFCYTKAGFDIPEEEWEWEYCDVPICEFDCYLVNGALYLGDHNVTQSGLPCVDWAGDHGLNGAKCRNPNNDVAPWCYVTEDHTQWDYCDNKCPEAVEYNPLLQSAVSTLTGGPLGVGDKAQNLDAEVIMKSCNAEGKLLHPSKPATVIDLYFVSPEYREIWTAESLVSDHNFGIIFLAEVDKEFTLSPFDLNLDDAFLRDVLVWRNFPSSPSSRRVVKAGDSVFLASCGGFMNFCVEYVSPIFSSGEIILGELEKWVPVSPQRITDVQEAAGGLTLSVSGVKGENVVISFTTLAEEDFDITCVFEESAPMTIDTSTRLCY